MRTKNKRFGSALEHGSAHERDHKKWSRRTFLRHAGLAGGASIFLNNLPVSAMSNSPLSYLLNNNDSDRILVLIRLKGGNDGLNTIVPLFDYGTYRAIRPTIAIPENQLLKLSDEFAIPSYMEAVNPLWQEGKMKVIHSVGYPDQNLSHFRSSDIWASASDATANDTSGWLGRLLDTQFPDFLNNPPSKPPAIQIGGTGNIVFNNSEMTNMGVIVSNPEELAEIAEKGVLYDPNEVPDCHYGEQLRFVRNVANSTFRYAEVIAEAYEASTNEVEYEFEIGEQLAMIARLIKGNLDTKLYMVSLDGFDTHAGQNEVHPYLLYALANGVKMFFEDLAKDGFDKKVLCMTFSEFGRRIEQNASAGTDHGAAAPLLLFGEGLNGNGFVGQKPDLHDLDDIGNLKFDIDFRQVYATVLENWLCLDNSQVNGVMRKDFPRLDNLGLACSLTTATRGVKQLDIRHQALYENGNITIRYHLDKARRIRIDVTNILGQAVTTLYNGRQSAGTHEVHFQPARRGIPASTYVYTIRAGSYLSSRKISVVR